MTDKPQETALDRLRAGLNRRNDPPSPTPGPDPSPDPPKPVAAAQPPDHRAPMDAPAAGSGQAPQVRETPAPPNRPDAMQEAAGRRELSRTRLRINLTWAAAVTLGTAIVLTAAYLSLPHMPDDGFSRFWPWRAHVWNRYGGAVIWCINEARKTKGPQPFVCQINFTTDGPDCPRPETRDVTAAYLCPPWETTWPTDPAPRWSADGPPHWSR